MKKIVILIFCLLALGASVFAYDMSVGFGGTFGIVKDRWEAPDEYKNDPEHDFDSDIDFTRMQFGGFGFFGTRYTEFSFTVRVSRNNLVYTDRAYSNPDREIDDTTIMLSVGAYGKRPFSLGKSFDLFPTIGVDFDAVDWVIYIWFRGGLGLDLFVTERSFIRGQALYGYGISLLSNDNSYKPITPGHGPLFKLGVGWMF